MKQRGSALVIAVIAAAIAIIFFGFAIALEANYRGEEIEKYAGSANCTTVSYVPADDASWVSDAAAKHLAGNEAALIALIKIESGWNAQAANPGSSATGLGQFTTGTAKGYKEFVGGTDNVGIDWPAGGSLDKSPSDPRFDPKRAIYATADLLSVYMVKYGNNLHDAYYFGYHGFSNSAQQQESSQGADRLMVAYNDLLAKQCSGTALANGTGATNGIYDPGKGNDGVPLYRQGDPRYGNLVIDNFEAFKIWGCCPTSAAMVLRYYGITVDPIVMGNFVTQKGFHIPGQGTNHAAMVPALAASYNLNAKVLGSNGNVDWDQVITYLQQQKPLIARGLGANPYSPIGHCIVITGYDSATQSFRVNNPAANHGDGPFPIDIMKKYTTVVYYLGK